MATNTPGSAGATVISDWAPAATVRTSLRTVKAGVCGPNATVASSPSVDAVTVTSMRLSLMTIGDAGVTSVSGQPVKVWNRRSSMMTSPVIDVTPAATTCSASESSAASGSPCTGALSRPLLA